MYCQSVQIRPTDARTRRSTTYVQRSKLALERQFTVPNHPRLYLLLTITIVRFERTYKSSCLAMNRTRAVVTCKRAFLVQSHACSFDIYFTAFDPSSELWRRTVIIDTR